MLIGKLWFGRDTLQFGLELCLARAGLEAYTVTTETAASCDLLLVSMFWYRDVYELAHFMRLADIGRGAAKPYILVGGIQASLTPEIIAELVDGVFIGDGEEDLGAIVAEIERTGRTAHPQVYHSGDATVPAPKSCAPGAFAIMSQGKKEGSCVRVEIARGCKFKCAFCALSHLKPYREVSTDDLLALVPRIGKRKCSLFAPDRTSHSGWSQIREALKRNRCQDYGSDVRLEHLGEITTNSATFGLEGLSERLRRSVGKPYSDAFVVERMGQYVESQRFVSFLTVYFILGLPGETQVDWDAFRGLLEMLQAVPWSRRLVFQPVGNPLSPKRGTPLADAHIDLFEPYPERWKSLLANGGKGWGFRIVKSRTWDPLDLVMDAVIQRGGATGAQVVLKSPSQLLSGWTVRSDRDHAARRLLATCEQVGIGRAQLEGGEEAARLVA